jgi:hypothetical protein
MIDDRDSARPDYDELAPSAGSRSGLRADRAESDYNGLLPLDSPRNGFPDADDGAVPDYEGPPHSTGQSRFLDADDSAAPDYDEQAPLDSLRNRFLRVDGGASPDPDPAHAGWPMSRLHGAHDGAEPDLDEPEPSSPGRRFLGAIAFVLLMALTGSGAAAMWYYYGPQLVALASTQGVEKPPAVEKPAVTLDQLAEEQRKLTQAIAALQLTQDGLQKSIAAREQEIQRLSGENRALRTDLDALRSAAASAAIQSPAAPKSQSARPPPKKKAERQPAAQPQAERAPMALTPQ